MARFASLSPALAAALIVVAFQPDPALAQWRPNGTPMTTAVNDQLALASISDEAGGAIVAWMDERGSDADIYAQRVSASGETQWAYNGVLISGATGSQGPPQLASDGSGGAIITWEDVRGSDKDIYAQRVDASGTPQWAANGVPVYAAAAHQRSPQITSDGAGGAIIAWGDERGSDADIYAQRLNASGTPQWTAGGEVVCGAAGEQTQARIVSDEAGGAIILWSDERGGVGAEDIYAQRVDPSGSAQWPADGVVVSGATGEQFNPNVASDGASGAIVAWNDVRSGGVDIYAQRVDSAGLVQWLTNGVPICTATGPQYWPQIISDGSGGAILAWSDYRSGSSWDVYAQKLNSLGASQWISNGSPVRVPTLVDGLFPPDTPLVSDGAGGAIIAFEDERNGNGDIYAARLSAAGVPLWSIDGAPVCTASGGQFNSWRGIVSNGKGGAVVVWHDERGNDFDIYANKVDRDGHLVPALGWPGRLLLVLAAGIAALRVPRRPQRRGPADRADGRVAR